jgi:hypothetical protein
MNAKTTKAETPKAACRTTRSHIARLMKMLEAELADREMREDTWPVAGSLGHVRELLGETVGFLKGVEGSDILDAMMNKNR